MSEIPLGEGPLNIGAFMAQAAGEGLGVTEARNALRAAGGAISNATFSAMYSEIRTSIAARDALQNIDYGSIPSGADYTEWTMGAEGDYATFVTSYVRVPGQSGVEERYFTYVTDQPHTPQEAIDAAADFYTNDQLTAESMAGGVYQGSMVTSMTITKGAG